MILFLKVLYIKVKEKGEDNSNASKFHITMNKLYELIKEIFCIVDLEEIFNGYIAKVPLRKIEENTGLKEKIMSNRNSMNYEKELFSKNIKEPSFAKNLKSKFQRIIINIKNCIITRKIRKIVNEKNIDGIVLADDIAENSDFVDKLILKNKAIIRNNKKESTYPNSASPFIKERKIFFFDGKGLFKYIIYEILVYIINIQNRKTELEDIYIIANTIDENMLDNIEFLSTKFKNINIVSKNIAKYKYIEEMVYNNTGNTVILLNNKRKSLKRAKYIINVDNTIDELKEYSIYRKAIIINMKDIRNCKTAVLQSFEGIFVNLFEIDLNEKTKEFFKKYGLINMVSLSILYESFLNTKESFRGVRAKIEDAGLIVTKLYGNNGIISENEYKRVEN